MSKIIYPTLVEDTYKFTRKQGFNLSKAELYKKLIEANFIDEQGNATQWAIDQGLINVYEEKKNMPLHRFKNMFKIFSKYSNDKFALEGGYWYVSNDVLNKVTDYLEQDEYTIDETNDVEAKGTNFPLYKGIDDSHFSCTSEGEVIIDREGIIQLSNNILKDKISGDKEAAKKYIEELGN